MKPWQEHHLVEKARKRWRAADMAVAAMQGYKAHRTGRNAAAISYYGFFSIFPLVLVLTTILGFVLQNRPNLQEDIIDSALSQLPIIGQQLEIDPTRLRGNTVVLIVGLTTALWAAMKAFVGLHGALDDIAEVPIDDRAGLVRLRLRALEGIAVIGGAQLGTVALSAVVGAADLGWVNNVLLMVAAASINAAVLAFAYHRLCTAPRTWREVVPGAIVGGILFAGFQLLGATVVSRAIANASPVYGTFASVIGLLTWLSLHATVALLGAELNRVLRSTAPPVSC